jgi:guanosine-3',5'-bis(diphosphate) 3'-pyrophosphohydrolase
MSPLILKAVRTAFQELERTSRQEGLCPSPCHLLSCLQIVAGYGGDDTQAAAALHEIIEVTRWPLEKVEAEFGRPVAALVAAVTEDRRLPWPQRKQEVCDVVARCGQPVGLVLMADKLDTLLALTRQQHGSPDFWARSHASFADQLWFHQRLVRALRSNRRVAQEADDPALRTAGLLDELTAALERFRGGQVWTPDGLQQGPLEDALK